MYFIGSFSSKLNKESIMDKSMLRIRIEELDRWVLPVSISVLLFYPCATIASNQHVLSLTKKVQ